MGQPFIMGAHGAHHSPALNDFAPIADVEIELTAELDRRKISFRELVRLDLESVVVLNRPAGENIDLLIGEVLLGSGELLVIDGSLAVRVAELRDRPTETPRIPRQKPDDDAAAA